MAVCPRVRKVNFIVRGVDNPGDLGGTTFCVLPLIALIAGEKDSEADFLSSIFFHLRVC